MLTVRKLRYFDFASAAVASLVQFIHTAQVTNGGVIGGGASGGNGGVNNGGVIGGGANGGNGGVNNGGVIIGSGSTNSPGALGGGSTHRPR